MQMNVYLTRTRPQGVTLLSLAILSLGVGCGQASDLEDLDAGPVASDGRAPMADASDPLDSGVPLDASASSDGGLDSGAAPADAGLFPDAADGGADAGPPPSVTRSPRWARTVEGFSTLGRARVAIAPDGSVVAGATSTSGGRTVTFGEGEPNETSFTVSFDPLLAVYGHDGALAYARRVSTGAAGTYANGSLRDLAIDAEGAVLATGDWHGTAVFHPDGPSPVTYVGERQAVGDRVHRAEDPFLVRWEPSGVPSWARRGRTPGPLNRSWFNYGLSLAAIGDGGAFVAGAYEATGFVVGDGTGGATTLSGTRQTYFARFDRDGEAVWVSRNVGVGSISLRSSPDGSVVALVGVGAAPATLAIDGPGPSMIEGTEGRRTHALVRFTPAGEIAWVRRLLVSPDAWVGGMAVRADGSVVVLATGGAGDDVRLEGATEAANLSVELPRRTGLAASYSADGNPEWITLLGTDAAFQVDVGADGDAFVFGRLEEGVGELPWGLDASEPLPAWDLPEGSALAVVHRVDAAGTLTGAWAIGSSLAAQSIAVRRIEGEDRFALVGTTHAESPGSPGARVVEEGTEDLVLLSSLVEHVGSILFVILY